MLSRVDPEGSGSKCSWRRPGLCQRETRGPELVNGAPVHDGAVGLTALGRPAGFQVRPDGLERGGGQLARKSLRKLADRRDHHIGITHGPCGSPRSARTPRDPALPDAPEKCPSNRFICSKPMGHRRSSLSCPTTNDYPSGRRRNRAGGISHPMARRRRGRAPPERSLPSMLGRPLRGLLLELIRLG